MKKNYVMSSSVLSLLLSLFLSTTYAQYHELAYWTGENTSTYSYPQAASGTASNISSASQNYSGLNTYNDNRNVWNTSNTNASVNPATDPYLEFTLNIPAGVMRFDKFVIAGAAPTTAGIKLQLRWDVDSYASSLGDFTPGGSSYNLTSVDLTSNGTVSAATVKFRIYFYAVSGNVFHSDTGPYTSLDSTPSSYGAYGRAFSVWGENATLTIQDQKLEPTIAAYPNPTNGNVKINLGQQYDNIKVDIFTIEGKQIDARSYQFADQIAFDINASSGFYLVKLTADDMQSSLKILKK